MRPTAACVRFAFILVFICVFSALSVVHCSQAQRGWFCSFLTWRRFLRQSSYTSFPITSQWSALLALARALAYVLFSPHSLIFLNLPVELKVLYFVQICGGFLLGLLTVVLQGNSSRLSNAGFVSKCRLFWIQWLGVGVSLWILNMERLQDVFLSIFVENRLLKKKPHILLLKINV